MSEDTPTRTSEPRDGEHGGVVGDLEAIGPYRLLGLLGEGGMGAVYLAEQKTPVERRVAIKVIKRGMDTREVVARFEAERQALAVMDHPGIAHVFDGGATDAGRPFFAMEYVAGEPLAQFCDRAQLSIRDRVLLMIDVCRAVQHAHQKGIIHRDLKPSNVLVSIQDGKPASKVIDFGVAKAIEKPLTDQTFATAAGQFVGTPVYMSPEQLGLTGQDVDTRADIYSLGVMLFELLAGGRPFDPKELPTGHSLIEAIGRDNPPTPSTRLTKLAVEQQRSVARDRDTDPTALRRTLRGDLDWIVMKAIDKDRTRRYDTANTLASDLQRYLADEPVVARPPSARYRARKFVARHRFGVAAAAAMLALIGGSTAVIAVQSARVASERDRATLEAARATSINEFLQEMLGSANPQEAGSRSLTVVDALAAAETRVDSALSHQPDVAGAVRRTLGQTYIGLGEYDRAERILASAVEASRASGRRQDLALDLTTLGQSWQLHGDHAKALQLQREAVAIATAGGVSRDVTAYVQARLGDTLDRQGHYEEAQRLTTESMQVRVAVFGAESREVARSYRQLAAIASHSGNVDLADELIQKAIAVTRKSAGPQHYEVGAMLNDWATVYIARGEFAKALPILEEQQTIVRAALGDNHPELATVNENVANVLYRLNRFDEAAARLEDVLAVRRKTLGDDSMVVGRTMHNMGVLYTRIGNLTAAEERLTGARERLLRGLGAEHPEISTLLRSLGNLLERQGNLAGAEGFFRDSLALSDKTNGPMHLQTATACVVLGRVLASQKRFDEAEPLVLRAKTIREKALGPTARLTVEATDLLAKIYDAWGKPQAAERLRTK